MYLLSGVYVSAATIGAVGRGVRPLDAELVKGFAAVLGVPISVVVSLAGIDRIEETITNFPDNADIATLLWSVRHLSKSQVKLVCDLAKGNDQS